MELLDLLLCLLLVVPVCDLVHASAGVPSQHQKCLVHRTGERKNKQKRGNEIGGDMLKASSGISSYHVLPRRPGGYRKPHDGKPSKETKRLRHSVPNAHTRVPPACRSANISATFRNRHPRPTVFESPTSIKSKN